MAKSRGSISTQVAAADSAVRRRMGTMQRFNQVPYEPEYNKFDLYYLPWYDNSCSSDGPYGEPLQYNQEGPFNKSNSVYDEAGGGFHTGSWYSRHRLADQVYDTMEGGSNWMNEYISYFASSFNENIVCADSINPWPSYHLDFVDGMKDNYSNPGTPEPSTRGP